MILNPLSVYSFCELSFHVSSPLSNWFCCFHVVEFEKNLIYSRYKSSVKYVVFKYFHHSITCLYILLKGYYAEQFFKNDEIKFVILFFYGNFGVKSEISLPSPRSWRLSSIFSSIIFILFFYIYDHDIRSRIIFSAPTPFVLNFIFFQLQLTFNITLY